MGKTNFFFCHADAYKGFSKNVFKMNLQPILKEKYVVDSHGVGIRNAWC
jgi:hypothetical protein